MIDLLAVSFQFPSVEELIEVLTLQRYNTRIVILGTMLLGLAAGVIGTYMLLRRRALFGDALSHATLPGIGVAFLIMVAAGGTGKAMPGLMLGAIVSGVIGTLVIIGIRRGTRIKEDAALGIVLSVFFGLGITILTLVQSMQAGNAAGLSSFIYGKTASMIGSDAVLIASGATLTLLVCLLLFKEFAVLSFDTEFAASQGWPVTTLDVVMMSLVTMVTVIGLQAVGMILIIALLIIPPAAARFWTDHLTRQLIASAAIGGISGAIGAGISALAPRMPAGAIIVVIAAIVFAISMVIGSRHGLIVRVYHSVTLRRRITMQHLLRALFEYRENHPDAPAASLDVLLTERSWTRRRLRRVLARARRAGHVVTGHGHSNLTESGLARARQLVRNHRLWELYLVTHADIAPSHVDRDADQIEHVLSPAMIARLESLIEHDADRGVPRSPHRFAFPPSEGGT